MLFGKTNGSTGSTELNLGGGNVAGLKLKTAKSHVK